jgi:exodeoxyribonuclease VIII
MKYEDIKAVHYSTLKNMDISPKEYKHKLTAPRKATPAMLKGSAFHCALLEPHRYDPKDYKLKAADETDVRQMVAAVTDYTVSPDYLDTEVPFYWVDEKTGLDCKCKPDAVLNERGFDEFKSISSTHLDPDKFMKHYANMNYHAQAAFYHDGMVANGLDPMPHTCYAVVQTAPHDVVDWEIPHCVIEEGRRLYRGWLDELVYCIKNDTWPGITRGQKQTMILPRWKRQEG